MKIFVIVNPASGSPEPILYPLSKFLSGYDWEVFVTKKQGDGKRLTSKALSEGAKLIISYGGDGTLLEVVSALAGSTVPLLILRGGTANVIADELEMPQSMEESLRLIQQNSHEIRSFDVGRINQQDHFLLRCGCGLEVSSLQETKSESKSSTGKLAYVGGFLRALSKQEPIDFEVYLNDEEKPRKISAIALTVANAGGLGIAGLRLGKQVSMDDGQLDLVVLEKAAILSGLGLLAQNLPEHALFSALKSEEFLHLTRIRKIQINTNSPVKFQADGDIIGQTPLEIEVLPAALKIICPKY